MHTQTHTHNQTINETLASAGRTRVVNHVGVGRALHALPDAGPDPLDEAGVEEGDGGEDDGPQLVARVPARGAGGRGAAALVPVLLYLAGEVGVLEVCAFFFNTLIRL